MTTRTTPVDARRAELAIVTELETLARAVAAEPRVRVVPGEHWQVDLATRTIEAIVRPADPVNWRRGGICHEAGHVLLTHHPEFAEADPDSPLRAENESLQQAAQLALNAIEDCRIERWLVRRIPGCAAWLGDLNRSVDHGPDVGAMPPFAQLLLSISHSLLPGLGQARFQVAPEVAALRDELSPAVADYLACQPPVRLELVADVARSLPEVRWPRWVAPPRADLSSSEAVARWAAFRSYEVFRDRIWPRLRPLAPDYPLPPGGLRGVTSCRREPRLGRASSRAFGGRELAEAADYDQVLAAVRPQVVRLSRALQELLEPATRLVWEPAETGLRANLSRAMAFDARRDADRLWLRRTARRHIVTMVSVLVDLSGSMHGEKIRGATAGVVLVAEAARRAGLPLVINGFQDALVPIKSSEQSLASARLAIAELALETTGNRPAGHNQPRYNDDGKCLSAAYEELSGALEYDQRGLLLVFSDGVPEPRQGSSEEERALLRQAIARAVADSRMTLAGIGLGPNTDHVADYYGAYGRANVPLEQLTAVLAEILRGTLARHQAG